MDAYAIRDITLHPGISRDGIRETFDAIVIRPGNTEVPNISLSSEAIRDRFTGAL